MQENAIAHHQLICNGLQGCSQPCKVEVLVRFFANEMVEIRSTGEEHGINFTPKLNTKIFHAVWENVKNYFHLEEIGYQAVSVSQIVQYLAKTTVITTLLFYRLFY